MNILIVGCRKVGSSLANYLSRAGHDVAIVDQESEHFDLLDDDFSGYTVEGVPIDQDVLKRAGIVGCEVLAAVSPDDNVNVMVSQLAREIFHVPRVIARIYDPQRKDVFSHFGLKTICPTNLTVEAISSMLTDEGETQQMTFDSTVVGFDTRLVAPKYAGYSPLDIPVPEGAVPFALLHKDGSMDLAGGSKVRAVAGDRLVVSKIVD